MSSFLLQRRCDQASLALLAIMMLAALWLHLLSALFAGMIAFLLIHTLAGLLSRFVSTRQGKWIAVTLISTLVIASLSGVTVLGLSLLKSEHGLSALFEQLAHIIEQAGSQLPASISQALPSGSEAVRQWLVDWLHTHAADMQNLGKEAGTFLAHVLVGMIIGSLLAFQETTTDTPQPPLAAALYQRSRHFQQAFRKVVVAQVQISLLNTTFTALYLLLALPLAGVHLPFSKTMLLLTFLLGLIPVLGNLLSNAIIITVSTTHSSMTALASLAFLVLIHKGEYFLNARIVGQQIQAKAWELLLAMLVMESLFGIGGVVAAPVYYAVLKGELKQRGLI